MNAPDDQKAGGGVDDDASSKIMTVAITGVASCGVVLTLAAAVGWGKAAAAGVGVGSVIAVGNLWAFARIGAQFLSGNGGGRARWGMLGAVKFVLLLALVAWLLRSRIVDAIPFVIGYAALPLGVTLSGLGAPRAHRR